MAIIKYLFHTISKPSKQEKHKCDLLFDEYKDMIMRPCYYCGLVGSNYARDRKSKKIKEGRTLISDTIVYYNGIDRLDSNKGYIEGNVVTCCKYCNMAKNTMLEDEFLTYIKRVYDYNFQ